MKITPHAVILALSCSIPAFVAGWLWSVQPVSGTEKPVQQVIAAIDSGATLVSSDLESRWQTAAIFDSLHQRTVTSFVETPGSFGITRIMKVEDMRHSDHWTLHPGRNDGFEVTLIGLDRETPVRFERESPEAEPKAALAAAIQQAGPPHPQDSVVQNEAVPLDELDLAVLEELTASEATKRAIFTRHESVVAFGPIRSSESCLKCHDGVAGELLGIFRYTFPLSGQPLDLQLAGNP